ncbi:MAG: hypothetical protein ACFFG0_08145 [Candidatus Thorarchaeota archaeon]
MKVKELRNIIDEYWEPVYLDTGLICNIEENIVYLDQGEPLFGIEILEALENFDDNDELQIA